MSRKNVTHYIAESTADEQEEKQTHFFSLNNVEYEIKLTPSGYKKLLEALDIFMLKGRRVDFTP
ncbi:histone-like nucleoid-structuring protein Lsr2 [Streptomyces sp. NPDC088847]|uniref:Lsr2 dimerization domain-containing protein n=1 Tax=Streptomyces sp. NPDC088847 TaxID=3365909 RepID=UPI0038118000